MWGSRNNGNRIHVVLEEERIVEVSCRLIAPDQQGNFAASIISLAERCDWVLILTEDILAEPQLELLLTAMRIFNASKFAIKPIEFLEIPNES